MDNQQELWRQVGTIKRSVNQAIGSELSYEFRSESLFQAYTGLCGEAFMAHQEGALDAETVALLQQYADKVIALGHVAPV